MTIKNNSELQASTSSRQLGRVTGGLFLLILFILLTACQPDPQELTLLQSKQFSSISDEKPVSLSFQANGAGPVLVQVFGHEAEFESRIIYVQGHTLNQARLPYIRTGPVYQLLETEAAMGRLNVQVLAIHTTKAADISIRVYQLPQNGRANQMVEQAYRYYSNGIQATDSEAVDLWRARVGELQKARVIGCIEAAHTIETALFVCS